MAGNGGPPQQQTQQHHHQQQQHHHLQQPHRPPGGMSDPQQQSQQQQQQQKVKSPPGNGPPMDPSAMPPHHHPYSEPPGGHGMPPGSAPPPGGPPPPPPDGMMSGGGKDDGPTGLYPGHPAQYQQRYHDPNVIPQNDPYSHYRVVSGGKPTMIPPSRPPQRYMPSPGGPGNPPGAQVVPGQPPQGPTPTLNSLLQSHPPAQHRGGYPNSYDHQQPPQQHPPPPPPQSPYGPHQAQGWAPPPRPYSPQMGGPGQPYRPPPPTNTSRGQSPYPPPGQSPGPYPPPPPPPQQQAPQQQSQQQQPPPQGPPQPQPPPPGPGVVGSTGGGSGGVTSGSAGGGPQYSPYPQRYPTPPGNHRSPYPPPHQYPEPTRAWPGPGGPSPAASPGPTSGHPHPPPSPQQLHPPQSPGHAPSPSPQPPQPAQSPHQYPNRPSQASTPNANDGDTGVSINHNIHFMSPHNPDSTGQNSNDSSSGIGAAVGAPPGTPNSQAMRPTPSPTGSSGSRSMSPAVGQQNVQMPPRPSSSHSQVPNQAPQSTQNSNSQHQQQTQPPQLDPATSPARPPTAPGSNPQQQSPAMAATQGSYQTPPPPPPHMHGGYKMGPSPGPVPGPGPQNMSPYPPQSQQYSLGNYTPRPQYPGSYGPGPGGQPPPSNSMPPGPGQYPGRPIPNHVGPHSQFPPYQQNWGPPAPQPGGGMMGNHVQQQQQQQQQPGGKNVPPPPPGPPTGGSPRPLNYLKQHLQHKGGYVGAQSPTPPQGYGNGPGMHPPMGPPHHMGPPMGPTGSMGPPSSAPQNPPSVGGTPTPSAGTPGGPNSHPDGSVTPEGPQDNGISSSGPTGSHPVTSLVTTGPDGAPLDEASQQSTLSNASAASAEDPQCSTPKSRKSDQYNQSHLAPPSASPGAHQQHEDFEMGSPTWSRTPASPVFNSHVPQETYRSTKKSDSLCKLYDMDDNPDRRVWLDKLLGFMEDRRSPITACPTISKQPLDLYRLYMLVKERGGFVEVTKSKTWKDIAGMLGIGASSSAAYTLRKHYTKNLLTFECHFDRGGIDPLPIIQQVEAGSKKKNAKNTSVPSPVAGSSNSQDSFPPPGSSGASMDGYSGYPSAYPQGSTPDYNSPPMQRPPSQTNAQSPHPGNAPPASGDNISVSNPFDDPVGPSRAPYQQGAPYPPVSRPQGAQYQGQPAYTQYGGPEQYGPPGPPGQYPPPAQGQFPPPNRTMYGPPYGPEGETSAPPTSNAPPTTADPYRGYGGAPSPYPPPPRPYVQQPPVSASQTPAPTGGPPQPGTPGAPGPYPPPPQQDYYRQPDQAPQPRRHPDFEKQPQPYSPYPQRPPMYGGWQNSTGQYRGQYPPQPTPQQWSSGQRPPGPPAGPGQGPPGQAWDRYPPQSQQSPYPGSQQGQPHWGGMGPGQPNVGPNAQLRPPQQRGKAISMPPPQGAKPVPGQFPQTGAPPKRDIVFPLDSVEATTPILYRRKRICKQDVAPIDPWRIFMSLRSGLLGETTWALDVINILLFDDSSVQYFGLAHLPGLLNLLLDHFQKSLADIFDPDVMAERDGYEWVAGSHAKMNGECEEESKEKAVSIDLGGVADVPNPEDRVLVLSSTTNYTLNSRKGIPVKINQAEDDIFVLDVKRSWDVDTDKKGQLYSTVGGDPWSFGQSEPHPHGYIMDCFRAEIVNIPFARYLKGKESVDKQHRKHHNSSLIGTNNRNGGGGVCKRNSGPSRTKRFKEEVDEAAVKKEPMDSDCRPVDMELEPTRIPNGPESVNAEEAKVDEGEKKVEVKKEDGGAQVFDLKQHVRDPASTLKRRRMSDYEDECYTRDEASLYLVAESQDSMARRCVGISNILRNLTFVPGNEVEFAKSSTFLAILGKLLLLNHDHPIRTQKTRNYDREEDADFADSCSSLAGETEWWWDYLVQIRENMLVAAANISGHMELSRYDEMITRPVLDGLLHWAICPSAHGQDPFPTCGSHSSLSPQRLALEALCKLCVTDANVDLVIATPPFSRLEKLCAVLTRHLCRNEDQVLREFSVNLLHYLAAADSSMARTVAMQSPCISYLVAFIEQAEQTALGVANQHGISFLRENPDSMGTSLDMLRRAAGTLLHLARHPDNRPLFMQQEQRLLGLVMSHILDQQVALIISRVLFQVSRGQGPITTAELKTSPSGMLVANPPQPVAASSS
ncbi:trithorax group protein osa isoform X4 [Lutzomyia longipalpis]|uniref:trithorax group protein osa isoform X4 n=1 Tax=Lutzomyia longipalpis TaxID=7200 RepID=UPI002483E0AD|nr:trithorax group protein osa isoform X4 [Lutzomyia longipalpis]